jgi:hypothetical protein
VLGYDALEIGLAFLPVTIVMGILSLRYAERLIMRFGARTTLLPGMALIAAGLVLFAQAPVDGGYVRDIHRIETPTRSRSSWSDVLDGRGGGPSSITTN